jgi:hypothetical protein
VHPLLRFTPRQRGYHSPNDETREWGEIVAMIEQRSKARVVTTWPNVVVLVPRSECRALDCWASSEPGPANERDAWWQQHRLDHGPDADHITRAEVLTEAFMSSCPFGCGATSGAGLAPRVAAWQEMHKTTCDVARQSRAAQTLRQEA